MRQAKFTVTLSKASTDTVTVSYATKNGTAVAPTDFTQKSGTLTFAPGETSKDIIVQIRDAIPNSPQSQFTVETSSPINGTIGRQVGVFVFAGGTTTSTTTTTTTTTTSQAPEALWLDRFNFAHDLLTNTDNGYFGPPTGPNAKTVPYHAKERAIIVEAPDWTHESVSETVSYWVKLEAWKFALSGDATGLTKAWDSIEKVWIPNEATGQPWADYNWGQPAGYTPDALALNQTPVAASNSLSVGADPIGQQLFNQYGTKAVYLMHWLIDVDGDYGFKNPDGTTVNVFINNYQRGPVEDGLATITHPCYDNFQNGGGTPYGWQPIYGRSIDLYQDGDQNSYSKQVNYSMAGDADVRAVGNTYLALKYGTLPTALKTKATKMADYIRYTLYDKYFRPIPGFDGGGCHYLLSWGCGFGVGLPVDGNPSYWGFRIGNSEIHHGYNGIDVAYAARTGSEFAPATQNSAATWAISLDRQLELCRWLQSPEGAIAGGVTSSWRGRYETPTDGRQNATFYGCYYNYSPSWFNPPSNNWTGFQAWGVQRISEVFVHSATKGSSEDSISHRCAVILDKFIPWFYNECTIDLETDTLDYPINSRWTSDTAIPGVTATQPSAKYMGLPENPSVAGPDVYEYLPTKTWPGSNPDYAAFWANDGTVPNPNLHCVITEYGWDPGTAAGFAQILIQYCRGKSLKNGSLSGTIPNTSILFTDVLQMAADIMEFVWRKKDAEGFGSIGKMDALQRLDDKLWVPPQFGTGHMPKGEVVANGQTTFASMRASFYQSTPEWSQLRAFLDGTSSEYPSVNYHRFWNGADVAVGFAMLHHYFPGVVPTTTPGA